MSIRCPGCGTEMQTKDYDTFLADLDAGARPRSLVFLHEDRAPCVIYESDPRYHAFVAEVRAREERS